MKKWKIVFNSYSLVKARDWQKSNDGTDFGSHVSSFFLPERDLQLADDDDDDRDVHDGDGDDDDDRIGEASSVSII